ncbi:hypothetical protein H8356DRAFT_1427531 [Neocallimastix lanati (nom. inval.)]|nr:hypothetical protein H8356DRAFT_1427531 [Neocallimastix sp. JGI-2020a]
MVENPLVAPVYLAKSDWRIRYIKSLEKLLIAISSVSKFNNKEDSHAVTEIQEDTKGIFIRK